MLDEKMGKVAKGEKKKNKKKYSFMFLRFYVEREALMIKDGHRYNNPSSAILGVSPDTYMNDHL